MFERRKSAGFGIPLLVLVVGMTIAFYAGRNAMEPIFDGEFNRGMAQAMKANPNITPEQVEQGRAFARGIVPVIITGYALLAPLFIGLTALAGGQDGRRAAGAWGGVHGGDIRPLSAAAGSPARIFFRRSSSPARA